MSQIIDSIVKISVNDAISTVNTTSVNTIAVVGAASKASAPAYKVCRSIDEAQEAFFDSGDSANNELYNLVVDAFSQEATPAEVVAIKAANFAAAFAAVKAAAAATDDGSAEKRKMNFYHIVAKSATVPEDADDFTETDGWNDWLQDSCKILHLEMNDSSTGFEDIIAFAGALIAGGSKRVAVYQHAGSKSLAASIVSSRCALDSARGSFAHKKASGVGADSYTKASFEGLTDVGVNVYAEVSGEARLFMGATCGAKMADSTGVVRIVSFIDQVCKDDWLRFNIQSKIYTLLGEANDGHGVNYNDAGITSVAASILQVLAVANDSDHQYIMDGYKVDNKTYDYLKQNMPGDVQQRNLPLMKVRYSRMNSIHTVRTVELIVTL